MSRTFDLSFRSTLHDNTVPGMYCAAVSREVSCSIVASDAVAELAEEFGIDASWYLVGGLMVQLHWEPKSRGGGGMENAASVGDG